MKHTKITVGFATLLCIFSLAGCQGKPQNQPVKAETEMQQTSAVSEPQTEQAQQESSETHPNNVPASAEEKTKELYLLLQRLKPQKDMIFDTTHTTNTLRLKGSIPKEKEEMLKRLEEYL